MRIAAIRKNVPYAIFRGGVGCGEAPRLKRDARLPMASAPREVSSMAANAANGDLKRFDVNPERGFLPEHDPERALPAPLALWQELASELPKRLAAHRVRTAVRSLPRFELAALRSPAEERAAMRVLSFVAHAFVWEGAAPEPTLPQQLAAPWCALARKLGRPPILSYSSYALDNWRRFDPRGPLTVDNLAILQNFLGGHEILAHESRWV